MVHVDGILYYKIIDAERAYGISVLIRDRATRANHAAQRISKINRNLTFERARRPSIVERSTTASRRGA